MFSFQRQIGTNAVLTLSYVGNQGHHLLMLLPTNPGNPDLCLHLSGCGPFGEDAPYTNASGQSVQGTRVGLGSNYGSTTAQSSIGNSNYNALETTVRYNGRQLHFLLGYTYGKSIDQGSNIGEELNPFNARATRTISAYDMKHNFVASYTLNLPFERAFHRNNRLTSGWSIAGTTRFSSGFPVTIQDTSDNSLLGTLGNGVNNYLLDTPQFTPGHLQINTNPRNGRKAFNTDLFHEEALGQLGNSPRRFFYGPGIDNTDITFSKILKLTHSRSFEFRMEAFNVFNHVNLNNPNNCIDSCTGSGLITSLAPNASMRQLNFGLKLTF